MGDSHKRAVKPSGRGKTAVREIYDVLVSAAGGKWPMSFTFYDVFVYGCNRVRINNNKKIEVKTPHLLMTTRGPGQPSGGRETAVREISDVPVSGCRGMGFNPFTARGDV